MKRILLFFFFVFAYAEEYEINLLEPLYKEGTIATDKGGIISAPGIRIQARSISYQPQKEVIAEGDLLIEYGGRILAGSRLEYDFKEHRGLLYQGRTQIDIWFISGDEIYLNPDHSLSICNATVTTSENAEPEWRVGAQYLSLTRDQQLATKNVTVSIYQLPLFWIPSLKANLKQFHDVPFTYAIIWDKGQDPKLSMRYRLYSWENFNLYFRADLRASRGLGGALESTYLSPDKLTRFDTRSYLAHDTFLFDNDPNKKKTRYRLQGVYHGKTAAKNWEALLYWDYFNDKNMPRDFTSREFELNTPKQSRLLVRNREERYLINLNATPRINSFQGFKQELPALDLTIHPFEIGRTGVISENRTVSAYLDYVYSDGIGGLLSDFHAVRLETDHLLYRSFDLRIADFTPYAGFTGIFYNNNPSHSAIGQAVFHYGADLIVPLVKNGVTYTHYLEPYLSFTGLSKPTVSPDNLFIFDIHDGYNRLNQLRPGFRTLFYTGALGPMIPLFSCDLYALGFFADTTFAKTFPKAYAEMACNLPSFSLFANLGWNFEEQTLDRSNIRLLFTVNSDIAFTLEYRHRSRFDWRKDDHSNYILDVTRQIDELLTSPLSDGRNTFLSRAQFKLTPDWTLRLQSHSGWGRKNEPSYTEIKVDLITLLTTGWQLGLSFRKSVRGPGFAGVTLMRQ